VPFPLRWAGHSVLFLCCVLADRFREQARIGSNAPVKNWSPRRPPSLASQLPQRPFGEAKHIERRCSEANRRRCPPDESRSEGTPSLSERAERRSKRFWLLFSGPAFRAFVKSDPPSGRNPKQPYPQHRICPPSRFFNHQTGNKHI